MDFHDYLRSQFSNLKEAKVFYKKWSNEWEQDIPDHPEWSVSEGNGFTLRAMAGHISDVLTGKGEFEETNSYLETKYGSGIYWS